ncbi:unnamed protein product [Paramecium sonneborni]|uniref:Uncharacterized protein n=1 Tax=Paramecium sonneborni TaxID=65129 RepID=A0A8S1RL17_9CILI|nr:unnamed protein product [Paramecium sonneborni]
MNSGANKIESNSFLRYLPKTIQLLMKHSQILLKQSLDVLNNSKRILNQNDVFPQVLSSENIIIKQQQKFNMQETIELIQCYNQHEQVLQAQNTLRLNSNCLERLNSEVTIDYGKTQPSNQLQYKLVQEVKQTIWCHALALIIINPLWQVVQTTALKYDNFNKDNCWIKIQSQMVMKNQQNALFLVKNIFRMRITRLETEKKSRVGFLLKKHIQIGELKFGDFHMINSIEFIDSFEKHQQQVVSISLNQFQQQLVYWNEDQQVILRKRTSNLKILSLCQFKKQIEELVYLWIIKLDVKHLKQRQKVINQQKIKIMTEASDFRMPKRSISGHDKFKKHPFQITMIRLIISNATLQEIYQKYLVKVNENGEVLMKIHQLFFCIYFWNGQLKRDLFCSAIEDLKQYFLQLDEFRDRQQISTDAKGNEIVKNTTALKCRTEKLQMNKFVHIVGQIEGKKRESQIYFKFKSYPLRYQVV